MNRISNAAIIGVLTLAAIVGLVVLAAGGHAVPDVLSSIILVGVSALAGLSIPSATPAPVVNVTRAMDINGAPVVPVIPAAPLAPGVA